MSVMITMSQAKYHAVLKAVGTLCCCPTSTENPAEFARLAASNIIRT